MLASLGLRGNKLHGDTIIAPIGLLGTEIFDIFAFSSFNFVIVQLRVPTSEREPPLVPNKTSLVDFPRALSAANEELSAAL